MEERALFLPLYQSTVTRIVNREVIRFLPGRILRISLDFSSTQNAVRTHHILLILSSDVSLDIASLSTLIVPLFRGAPLKKGKEKRVNFLSRQKQVEWNVQRSSIAIILTREQLNERKSRGSFWRTFLANIETVIYNRFIPEARDSVMHRCVTGA